MIQDYQIKNFKSFVDSKKIPIKPITLIFGANSSGKSSILQSLLMLKQTLSENKNFDAHLITKGEMVDVGNFKTFIYKRDLENSFSFRMTFSPPVYHDPGNPEDLKILKTYNYNLDVHKLMNSLSGENLGLEVTFSWNKVTSSAIITQIQAFIGDGTEPIITYKLGLHPPSIDREHKITQEPYYNPIFNFKHSYWKTYWKYFDKKDQNGLKNYIDLMIEDHYNSLKSIEDNEAHLNEEKKRAKTIIKSCKKGEVEQALKSDSDPELLYMLIQESDELRDLIKEIDPKHPPIPPHIPFPYPPFVDEKYPTNGLPKDFQGTFIAPLNRIGISEHFLKTFDKSQSFDLKRFRHALQIYKNMFRAPLYLESFIPSHIGESGTGGDYSLNDLRENTMEEMEIDPVHYWTIWKCASRDPSLFSIHMGDIIKKLLQNIKYIAPLREPPKRIYELDGIGNYDMDFAGKKIPEILFNSPNAVVKINEELNRIGFNLQLKISPLTTEERDIDDVIAIQFIDKTGDVAINIKDIGFGISQALPIIAQSIISKEKILLIEQPELHIHPKFQAELGDLFIKSALGEQKNTFIIETHSEHLILRLLRRVRETADGRLPDGVDPIYPKDLSIIYVKNGENGSEVIHLPVTNDGDFDTPWPDGFFEEREEELFY